MPAKSFSGPATVRASLQAYPTAITSRIGPRAQRLFARSARGDWLMTRPSIRTSTCMRSRMTRAMRTGTDGPTRVSDGPRRDAFVKRILLATCLLASCSAQAIVVRHDVADSEYLALEAEARNKLM